MTHRYKTGDRVRANPKVVAALNQRPPYCDARQAVQEFDEEYGEPFHRLCGRVEDCIFIDFEPAYSFEGGFFLFDHEVK